mgnify:CR=1 FL=1
MFFRKNRQCLQMHFCIFNVLFPSFFFRKMAKITIFSKIGKFEKRCNFPVPVREKIWKNVKNRWQITGILPGFTTCLRIHLSHFSEFFANFSTRGQFLPIFANFCRFWEILENSEKSQNAKFTLFYKNCVFFTIF